MVSGNGSERVPAELVTVSHASPGSAVSSEGIWTNRRVQEKRLVRRGDPFQETVEPASIARTTPGSRSRCHLSRGGLDEVRAGGHGEVRGLPHVVVRLELSGLQNHLQASVAGGVLDGQDLRRDLAVVACEERPAVDHHVDLIGAHRDRPARVFDFDRQGHESRRKPRRDRGDSDAAARQGLLGHRHEVGIDADRRDMGNRRVARQRTHRLLAELADLSFGVSPLERR